MGQPYSQSIGHPQKRAPLCIAPINLFLPDPALLSTAASCGQEGYTVPSAPFQRKLELVQGGPLPQHFLTPFGSLVSRGMGDLPPSPTPRQPRMESSDESLGYPGFRVSKIEYTAPDLEARLLPLGQNRLISLGMLTEASILPKGTKEFGIFPGWSNQTCFAIFYSFLPLGHHSYGELELLYLLWPTVPSVKWR